MASSTGKRWVAVVAGIALIGGVVGIAGIAVAASGPVPPDPPANVAVAPTDKGATEQVEFAPPANDGGDPILNETHRALPATAARRAPRRIPRARSMYRASRTGIPTRAT